MRGPGGHKTGSGGDRDRWRRQGRARLLLEGEAPAEPPWWTLEGEAPAEPPRMDRTEPVPPLEML